MTDADSYLRSRTRFVLEGMRATRATGQSTPVGLGWVDKPPVSNQELGTALCSLFAPSVTRIGQATPNGTIATWTIFGWTCIAANNRVLVSAHNTPSAHSILALEKALDRVDTLSTDG